MPSVSHTKRKERLALATRIENSNRSAQTCSHCRKQSRKCLLDLAESARCSECVRSKRPCDTKGYQKVRPPPKVVCRFFLGPRQKRLPTPPADPPTDPFTSWLPAFELSGPGSDDWPFGLELDPNTVFAPDDPLWASLGFGGGTPPASRSSS